jgi:uncharacterized protein (DUF1501 family)
MEPHSALQTRRGFIRQALCAAVGTAAITNTIRDLRYFNAAIAQSASTITDYKALICIFLNGGNDSNNLFIPTIPAEWSNYAAIRTPVLAIPNTDGSGATALALNNLTNDGHTYGIHPAAPELQTLFNAGKLAGVFNVGTLVYPVTKAQYTANSVPLPPQLFSHADQQVQWQTSVPDRPPSTGWGGRCADLLDPYNPKNGANDVLSMCISLAGSNTFEVGGVTTQYSVSSSGVVALNQSLGPGAAQAGRTSALTSILGIDAVQQNMLVDNYALALEHALSSGTGLTASLGSSPLSSYWKSFPTTVNVPNGGGSFTSSLLAQMKMVAQVIEAGAQANLFAELSQSMNAFQNAMIQIGVQNSDPSFEQRVTAFTSSDFGRTFPSNSLGSDHGWGSHHLVLGGGVLGQHTYGNFPALVVGGPNDTSTGRWIPTTSVDQFAATMATWFGVDGSNIGMVFPNLGRFSVPNLGFMASV